MKSKQNKFWRARENMIFILAAIHLFLILTGITDGLAGGKKSASVRVEVSKIINHDE